MILPVHPFPARMAPDLALQSLYELDPHSVVLDPMMGSGTVIRHAAELGFDAIGFDMDPLAVLMASVWTRSANLAEVRRAYEFCVATALRLDPNQLNLSWIDDDRETRDFVKYWFGPEQEKALRCISAVLVNSDLWGNAGFENEIIDVLRLALSRIIITKEQCASLARDTSHSRPHKVCESSDYCVFTNYGRSVEAVIKRLQSFPVARNVKVGLGDARATGLSPSSVDAVLTSPPYLNAIDYLRGHRMSLVWLGHKVADLRGIRSNSIGAERAPSNEFCAEQSLSIQTSMTNLEHLTSRNRAIVRRYAQDLYLLAREIARVLRPGGRAILVVGNSCLKGSFIKNSDGMVYAASIFGLRLQRSTERTLPERNRYLPMPSAGTEHLGKRMRTETVLTFSMC